MKKLSEQLAELEFGQNDASVDFDIDDVARGILDLETTNAELAKRVAELEATTREQLIRVRELESQSERTDAEIVKLDQALVDAAKSIESLQSQLAWTPVSAGLPTEPGWYVFYDSLRRFTGWLTCFELRHKDKWPWIDDEGDEWNQPEFEAHTTSLYTHYRKIELPKGGES